MKTLHVSDMDGTLLDLQGEMTLLTANALTDYINQGLLFTVATGRSPLSTAHLLRGIPLKLPLILLNGALMTEADHQTVLCHIPLTDKEKTKLLELEAMYGLNAFKVFYTNQGLFYSDPSTFPLWNYFSEKLSISLSPSQIIDPPEIANGDAELLYVFLCDDRPDVLRLIADKLLLDGGFKVDLYKDAYLPDTWFLETYSRQASKGRLLKELRGRINPDKIISYGDSLNDLSLFSASDFSCAVKNARELILEAADLVIPSNLENGVISYIETYFRGDC